MPKTLLRLRPEHEIAVVEMGASHPGDIKKLIEYVEPTCGMITNVGRAHLQGFGSFDGVKRTKGELYDFIKATGGLIFLNESNADLVEMASEREMPRIETYGRDGEGSVTGSVTKCDPFLNFTWHISSDADDAAAEPQGTELHTKLVGAYNIDNALAAITIGLHFGVTAEQCSPAIENYTPSNDRSELTVTEHNHLIVDGCCPRQLPADGCSSQDGNPRRYARARRIQR